MGEVPKIIDEIYVVHLGQGDISDYRFTAEFATHDKELAENWVNKYNRIVAENRDRICAYEFVDGDVPYGYWEPYCYNLIKYNEPEAMYRTIKIR